MCIVQAGRKAPASGRSDVKVQRPLWRERDSAGSYVVGMARSGSCPEQRNFAAVGFRRRTEDNREACRKSCEAHGACFTASQTTTDTGVTDDQRGDGAGNGHAERGP